MIAHVRGVQTSAVAVPGDGGGFAGSSSQWEYEDMAEVFVEFSEPVTSKDGERSSRGRAARDGQRRWQGWIEFVPVRWWAPLRSGRETTQPNRHDTAYWATGLTPVYLEGALDRALEPIVHERRNRRPRDAAIRWARATGRERERRADA